MDEFWRLERRCFPVAFVLKCDWFVARLVILPLPDIFKRLNIDLFVFNLVMFIV